MKAAMTWLTLRNRSLHRWVAVLCLVLFVSLQAFVVSGALHRAVHSDASAPGHGCLITLFAHGQVNTPDVAAVLVTFIAVLLFSLPPLRAVVLPSFDYRLSLSRAPPRS